MARRSGKEPDAPEAPEGGSAREAPGAAKAKQAGSAAPRVLAKRVAYRLDLDKTYLATGFESVRQLVKIPFETADDKVALPAVPELVRALRRTASEAGLDPRVFFLSASPPQIGRAIREKLANDGLVVDGIVFKDQVSNLVKGRWGSLKEQVGYKLFELLRSRGEEEVARHEILFGDDWESDPIIYSLYADILAGDLGGAELEHLLVRLGVSKRNRPRILGLAEGLSGRESEVVERIFIRLERRTPPAEFRPFGPRLVPTYNYFQTAAVLYDLKRVDLRGTVDVARALRDRSGVGKAELRNSLDDLVRRGHLMLGTRARVLARLEKEGLSERAREERALGARLRAARERWRRRRKLAPFEVDYEALLPPADD